ncbi:MULTISPECIES: helix-turn-helix domain-containing protein [Rhizobium]|uniref:XRE family transcriptional regulator n=1 Tax=Rhizobium leguminosarum bv. viciae TaxID=387 RepID=A0A8G2MPI6_RHILV|nr:helix-turn-helix domain-containing protein [Rhizobium leguminosarum]NKK11021.1 XRE family transcriptional regulator [Rhizobium leguminosarum bv. viciae]NKK19408.1 XRE family transcriptional regulator [Rhizobium leguminosarum bv. viciae]TBX85245.1 XRE family transcriptional regulator [Rhizobium leguminosarum bv. viciae]TBZ08632.1 XRE family transcriptional regulator [Rhizobium leguminosarum bv. viciae]
MIKKIPPHILAAARVAAKLSQEDLAARANLSRHTIMRAEEKGVGLESQVAIEVALKAAGVVIFEAEPGSPLFGLRETKASE